MFVHEVELTEAVLEQLIRLSEDWAAENSCRGYCPNGRSDIEGNRIFLAEDDEGVAGYLFGNVHPSKQTSPVMPDGTPYFEVEELYVVPEKRSRGIGRALFRYAEEAVKAEADYMMVGTATKNWKAVFHFYLEELDMTFWSARLFRRIEK
ncbi:MAG: GNAT family N-acetyltransferase [Clostridia bacterium]|nr:GNAT family N-acetyltransferase [Clostridia bacterium]